MRRGLATLGIALVVTASSCASNHARGPTATLAEEPATTTTVEVIDLAYINRLLASLDHTYGDAMRVLVRDKAITPEFERLMRSIYAEDRVGLTLELARHQLEKRLVTVAALPGDPVTTVQRVIISSPRCIFLAVKRDLSAVGRSDAHPLPVPQEYIGLRHGASWRMAYEGFRSDGSAPPAPC